MTETNSIARISRHLAVALCLLGPVAASAQQSSEPQPPSGDDPTPYSEIQLVSSVASIRPGTPFTLGVHITVDPGWHTYWVNGGDAGDELLVDWALPEGFTAGPLQFPTPHLVPAPPLMSYGYEGQVFVLVEITPPIDAPVGEDVELLAAVDYQVCADVCLIALDEITVTLPVIDAPPASDANWAATLADTGARLARPGSGWTVRAWRTAEDTDEPAYVIEIVPDGTGSSPSPASLPAPHLFADSSFVIEHAAPQRVARSGEALRMEIARNYYAAGFEDRIGGILVDEVGSSAPRAWWIEAAVEDAPPPFGLAGGEVALTGGVPEGMAPLQRPAPLPASGSDVGATGLAMALLLAFAGGLILNLMPCVFPVLSLKVLGFVEHGGHDQTRVGRHGLAYGAGVIACFWVLAATLIGLRAGGESLGWGFQLQSPVLVAVLALLVFGLGLNMSGVFELGTSLTRLGGLGAGDRYRDSFLTGALTVLVATPCTAPFMGAALGYALIQPAPVGLSIFTALAVGLAAPYVVLAFSPPLLRRLPRPGPWMATVRQALAFPMYGTVVWLVWVFGNQAGVDASAMLLLSLTLIALAAWVYGRFSDPLPSPTVRAVALLIAFTGVVAAVGGGRSAEPAPRGEASSEGWHAFSPERVASLRAEGRPVFIDFTADWCLSCKVNERVALGTDAVRGAFERANVALVVADWTNRDATIAKAIEGYGRSGVPLYVLYPADPAGEPVILPAVLTPGIVIEAVERAAQ
jgi:thiol:disulfide interchange protein DsbD